MTGRFIWDRKNATGTWSEVKILCYEPAASSRFGRAP